MKIIEFYSLYNMFYSSSEEASQIRKDLIAVNSLRVVERVSWWVAINIEFVFGITGN